MPSLSGEPYWASAPTKGSGERDWHQALTTSWETAGSRVSEASGVLGDGDLEHVVVDEDDIDEEGGGGSSGQEMRDEEEIYAAWQEEVRPRECK